jgi:hypothetical protein
MYLNGKKIAECFKSKTSLNSGDEPQFGDEGFLGMSDGATTTQFDFDTIVPVAGMSVAVETQLLNKNDVDFGNSLVNGKIWTVTARVTKAEYDSDAKAGTLVGSFSAMGGKPKLT